MLQSSRSVQYLRRIVALLAIGLWLWPPLTLARTFSIARTQEPKANAGEPSQNPPDLRQLGTGRVVERELQGGQSHVYQIQLAAGQYLSVLVEQRGIDVAITL